MTDEVLTEQRDHVRIITLNRPASMNAVNKLLAEALGEALHDADLDADTRSIVLTGAGRAFCAGMDLKAFAAGESALSSERPEWGFAGIAKQVLDTPVIAAVNGVAVGGGAEIVLACDMAVAAQSVRIGFPEVTRGLVAAGGGVVRLQRQVPRKIALEMVLSGGTISAERAAEIGLVNRVVPDGEALASALQLASLIAANAPLAVRTSKRFMREADRFGSDWTEDVWEEHERSVLPIFDSEDAAEGSKAFAEKRPPQWSGR